MKRAVMAVLGLVAVFPAGAEERRQLEAHEHGHSVLNIAIEGGRVAMELTAPGMDIVGFEHEAESVEQRAAVAQAEAVLADPLALFVLPAAAGCTLETAAVAREAEAHEDDDEHDADEDAHHEDEHESSHSAFHAEYGITCRSPGHVGSIAFTYFDAFPGAQEIDVTVITESGQSRYEVERDAPRIDLKGLI